jgi:succinate---hydroxymethylglutarate CoA-transferase
MIRSRVVFATMDALAIVNEEEDSRIYQSFADRLRNRDRITEMLDGVLSTRSTEEWLAVFAGRVPAAPVNDIATALDGAFARSTGQVLEVEAPGGERVGTIGPAIRMPGVSPLPGAAPALGADLEAVLGRLGYGPEEIRRLRQAGAL